MFDRQLEMNDCKVCYYMNRIWDEKEERGSADLTKLSMLMNIHFNRRQGVRKHSLFSYFSLHLLQRKQNFYDWIKGFYTKQKIPLFCLPLKSGIVYTSDKTEGGELRVERKVLLEVKNISKSFWHYKGFKECFLSGI